MENKFDKSLNLVEKIFNKIGIALILLFTITTLLTTISIVALFYFIFNS